MWSRSAFELGRFSLTFAELGIDDHECSGVVGCELHPSEQIGGLMFREPLSIDDGVEEDGGAHVLVVFSIAVKLQNGCGDIGLHAEDVGDDLFDVRPLLARGLNGVEHGALTSGDQVISELGGMLFLLLCLITHVFGEADEFPLCKPDSGSEIGGSGLSFQVEVSLHEIKQLIGHGLSHGAASGAGGNSDGVLCGCGIGHGEPLRDESVLHQQECISRGKNRTLAKENMLLRITIRSVTMLLRITIKRANLLMRISFD